jgi:hypothetical protein
MQPVERKNCFTNTVLSIDKWIHDHSKFLKITRGVFDVVGLSLIACSAIAFTSVHLPLLIAGAFFILITELAYRALNFFGFLAIDSSKHAFKKEKFGKSEITYIGHVPVLNLKENTPYENGYAHGYLMAPYIFKMLFRTRFSARLFGMIHFSKVKESLPEIKKHIPSHYLKELEGLAKGMNDWDKKHSWIYTSRITLDELILFQLVPDMAHLTLSNLPLVGCSVIADRDEKTHFITIGRHLDWPSFGTYGSHTILIHRGKTVSIGVPGLIGDLTVINKGLFLALNVCSPRIRVDQIEPDKMPSVFLMRYISEHYTSVESLKTAVQDQKIPISLVPFHANAADKQHAIALHFRQDKDCDLLTVVRSMGKKRSSEPFTTFNNHHPTETTESHHLFFAKERAESAKVQFAKHAASTPLKRITQTLKADPINNHFTIHHIIYTPATNELHVRFDNSFAASGTSESLSLTHFFSV